MKTGTPNVAEDAIQAMIVEGLQLMSFTVLVTTHRVKKCWHCGRFPKGGYGASKGIPDLLVTHKKWPKGMWLGMEVKAASTRLSPEQKELESQNRICVVRSWDDALAVVKWVG